MVQGKMNVEIPVVSTGWTASDLWNTIKVRWSVRRMNYTVAPGLYAVGAPGTESHVFVTANFKLTFDLVRRELAGMNAWLLVLDTRGINVWCAAGKGTFSTDELILRIEKTGLSGRISHRKVIVPQLGAVGISAHEVKARCGYSVIYGPVRATDIPAYVASGLKASPEMRKVNFSMWDRMKLIPVELANGKHYLWLVPALFLILSGINRHGYSVDLAYKNGLRSVLVLYIAYLVGCGLTPALLPWVPFRRFALKGLLTGMITSLILMYFGLLGNNVTEIVSWFLMIGAVSSFTAMNFTGTSTFTSLSGVQKEMKTALPAQITMAGLGVILWIISKFIGS